jgi:hypothetical protein
MDLNVKSWAQAMKRAWGANPAGDLLDSSSIMWSQLGLKSITQSEAVSFAITGRVLKYGQSIAIALPMFSSESAIKMMLYLHRLRFDALLGAVRAPWLNPTNVTTRTDFVLFSRPQSRFADLSRFTSLHTKLIRRNPDPIVHTHHAQTLLVDASMALSSIVELIEKSRPCAFVIDGTSCGTDRPGELDWALHENFSSVPRIVLLSLGDRESLQSLNASRANTHRFVFRLGDSVGVGDDRIRARIAEVGDATANEMLHRASSLYLDLRREQASDPVLGEQLGILGKVIRLLHELVVPLQRLEGVLTKATRAGPYPIRSITRLLEILGEKHCRYGQIQNRVEILAKHLRSCVDLLLQPNVLTGKAQAVLNLARDARAKRQPFMFLCGGSIEAQALELWLDDSLDLLWRDSLHVLPMDGLQSYRRAPRALDRCVLIGTPWDNRLKWLALESREILVLTYPFQSIWSQHQVRSWWLEFGIPSADDGDKLQLWSLRFPNATRLIDAQTAMSSVDVQVEKLAVEGAYPRVARVADIPLHVDLDSALLDLMAEPEIESGEYPMHEDSTREFVTITTEESDYPLQWPREKRVLVLEEDEISEVLPTDLSVGARLILLKNCEERVATQETLFDLIVDESHALKAITKVAEQWQSWCDKVASKSGGATAAKAQLRRRSIDVHEATIANWFRHGVIGPQDRKVVSAFAELVGVPAASEAGRVVANAIEKIRGIRRSIGRDLRVALLERTKGADKVSIGSLAIDGASFDAMIEVCHVVAVDVPLSSSGSTRRRPDLDLVAEEVMETFPGRLLFTTPARKSMRDSPFRDSDKFRQCLELMCTSLHDNLRSKANRFDQVLAEFWQAGIEYSANLSEVTEGRYGELRQYKGRKADMRRHFKIGTARDATRTMRIHFEWDDDISSIVVHHAGKHLTNSLT